MSHIQQTVCDAPGCGQVRKESNGWWIIRERDPETAVGDDCNPFTATPMSQSVGLEGDKHYCSSQCMHKMLDAWMDSFHPLPTAPPRCTCNDTYEIGSGNRCPIHEGDKN